MSVVNAKLMMKAIEKEGWREEKKPKPNLQKHENLFYECNDVACFHVRKGNIIVRNWVIEHEPNPRP